MLAGEIKKIEKKEPKGHFKGRSRAYHIDISGDGRREYMYFKLVDGKIYLVLKNARKETIYNFKFPINGHSARVYKVLKKKISKDRVVTLFFFYDGHSSYLGKKGTASLYGGVVDKGSFEHFDLKKLASIWLEEEFRETYKRRLYEVGFKDIDMNGQLEVIVNGGQTKRIIHYKGKGEWIGL